MDGSSETEATQHALSQSSRIQVAQIDHNSANQSAQYIEATVVLVWPYSSLTNELSLLLAERDVVLRKAKGQIKVTFHDAVARKVAQSKVGIGERLKLSIGDATVVEEQDEVSTPGKKAGFTLHFTSSVRIEIFDEKDHERRLDYFAPSNHSPVRNGNSLPMNTPQHSQLVDIHLTSLAASSSPAFRTGSRLSSNSYPGSFVDPFAAEDGSVPGRGRKRTKFARPSGAWRLEDSDSDIEVITQNGAYPHAQVGSEHHVIDLTEDAVPLETSSLVSDPKDPDASPPAIVLSDEEVDIERITSTVRDVQQEVRPEFPDQPMPSESQVTAEQTPSLPVAQQLNLGETPLFDPTRMPTPRLQALSALGLPLISPLFSKSQYFPPFGTQLSELDASAQPQGQPQMSAGSLLGGTQAEAAHPNQYSGQDLLPADFLATEIKQANSGVSPDSTVEAEVDLDALQQQIELSNASDLLSRLADQIQEDDDMYGSPNTQHKQALAPQSQHPISLRVTDKDTSHITSQTTAVSDRLPFELQETPVVDTTEPLLPSETQPFVTNLQQPAEDAQEIVDQEKQFAASLEADETLKEAAMLLGFRDGTRYPQPSLQAQATQSQSLDGVIDVDYPVLLQGQATNDLETTGPITGDDHASIMSTAEPLPNHRYDTSPTAAEQVLDVTIAYKPETAPENRVFGELPTPQATQAGPTGQKAIPQAQIDPQGQPLTPFDTQELPNAHHVIDLEPEEIIEDFSLPPLPTEKTPVRRASQRLRDKPRTLDGVYSDYFTPRRSSAAPMISTSPEIEQRSPTSEILRNYDHVADTEAAEEKSQPAPQSPASNLLEFLDAAQALSDSRRGLTTDLAYYVGLNSLHEHYNQLVDVIAICTVDSTTPERAKSGPRDFHTTIHLADNSWENEENTTITAQIFRPRKNAIPSARRGDILLLRNFKVQTQSHKPLLLSCDESAWAVLHNGNNSGSFSIGISGPPVEFGDGEEQFARILSRWWTNDGHAKYASLLVVEEQTRPESSSNKTSRGKAPPPPPLDIRRSPRKTRHEHGLDAMVDTDTHRPKSPGFNPTSPTFSYGTARSSMPPPSSAASPTSPISGMTLRSSQSTSLAIAAQASSRRGKSKALAPVPDPDPAPTKPSQSTPSRRHTRSSTQCSLSTSTVGQSQSQIGDPSDLPFSPTTEMQRHQRHPSETYSVRTVTASETSSTKNFRRSRRSNSLIHELRDGTQWVDVQEPQTDEEGASDSEHETEHAQTYRRTHLRSGEGDAERVENLQKVAADTRSDIEHHDDKTETGAVYPSMDEAASEAASEAETAETPPVEVDEAGSASAPTRTTKCARGRSSKVSTQPPRTRTRAAKGLVQDREDREAEAELEMQPVQGTSKMSARRSRKNEAASSATSDVAAVESGRVTRSKGKTVLEGSAGTNVMKDEDQETGTEHELRDGARYRD